MDLQPNQSNYNEGDRLQTSENLSGFFSRITVSNKTMERIMRQDSNLSPYDGFRIGGIGKVLNQIGLNQRRHHIIYKVSSGEFAISMELTGNVMEMQLIPKEEILEELRKLMFDIHPGIAYNLADQDFSRVLTLHQDFKRKDLMKEGNRPYSITYRIAYALSNTYHSDLFLRKEYIEIPKIFKKFAKDQGFAQPGVFPKEAMETLPVIAGRDFSQKILILNKGDEIARFSEESKLSLENVKRLIQRNFSENPLAWWDRNKIEATLKVKEECKYEYVRYKPIQMNMEDKKDMQTIIKEHINLGLIEPESLLTVALVSFIKDLAKYRKDFRPLLKETESSKWKWEEIHNQRVRELKQICSNLPKLAIPQDEDELVVYTDANDYRWVAVLMKKTTTGEEPCRYIGGLFSEQQAQVWHINEKEFFAVWKAFKKWPLFLLAKEFTLKSIILMLKLS
ncbi:UNVERIFIED_CONTAM: movement protein [Sesamum radiatum]|uniref:Movement protein n=1 Tax=Sesamum radiatum TaxID=300843 RepID=A0AAW2W3A3_SESRA